MLPDYATILIALVSAGVAGLGGGLLQVRHERRESLWDRRIVAADDLATKLAQAVMGAGDAVRESAESTMAELQRLRDEALAASARVDLLFGLGSPTVVAVNLTVSALGQVEAHLESDPSDAKEAQKFLNEAGKHLNEFTAAAGVVIRRRR